MTPPQPVALVTGSGKERVGNVVATTLAAAGYRIAVHYYRSKDAAEQTVLRLNVLGASARAFGADLRRQGDVTRLVHETVTAFGRIDVLVCAAAVWGNRTLEATDEELIRQQWESNTLATFLCCQRVGEVMVSQPEGGSIVTIGDWAVHRPYRDYAAYMVSKGAIPTLTRTMAVELASRNPRIRVNCILPGPVMLPPDLPPAEREEAIHATLLRREGSPENVAHAVKFFVENDFVTGVCLPVDGGRSIYAGGI